jgi:photosystem II stability/assembly factor-like uncharacterized protein
VGPAPPPTGWLYASDNEGTSWSLTSKLPGDIGPYLELLQPNAAVGYALAPGENNTVDGRYGGLVKTTDGGSTWSAVDQPCDVDAAPRFYDNAEFGAVGATGLWMACGLTIPATRYNKVSEDDTQVLRSSDGGTDWSLVAGTQELKVKANFPDDAGIPTVVGATGTSVFSATGAWLVLTAPSRLVRTSDGGRTWTNGAPEKVESEGPQQVVRAGQTILVRTRSALWRLQTKEWVPVRS